MSLFKSVANPIEDPLPLRSISNWFSSSMSLFPILCLCSISHSSESDCRDRAGRTLAGVSLRAKPFLGNPDTSRSGDHFLSCLPQDVTRDHGTCSVLAKLPQTIVHWVPRFTSYVASDIPGDFPNYMTGGYSLEAHDKPYSKRCMKCWLTKIPDTQKSPRTSNSRLCTASSSTSIGFISQMPSPSLT
ncbi:hypothetical protein C8R45DRAFT_941213 [Mycena sanguinolenta]|nr:hypothetical protein C8R45DRAFT_941213 [Mycena sanguinolenta]